MVQKLLQQSLKTNHNRIVLCGLFIGLFYLALWLGDIVYRASQGLGTPLVLVAAAYLGLQELWYQRRKLNKLIAPIRYRRLGHILILTGVCLFPFFQFGFWSQSLLWLLILVGIALSTWGIKFFQQYPQPTLLLVLSLHPSPDIMLGHLWRAITPVHSLDRFMAWVGSLALQAIGQPATANGRFIFLPTGSVEVGWGCNGFDMAITMALTGLVLSLFLRQNWNKTVKLIAIGAALALMLNVPRIVLVTLAAVYWGEQSFEFWHGAWGGQIFSAILFTAYYYLMKSILFQRLIKSQF